MAQMKGLYWSMLIVVVALATITGAAATKDIQVRYSSRCLNDREQIHVNRKVRIGPK